MSDFLQAELRLEITRLRAALAEAREKLKEIGYYNTEGCDYRTTVLWFQAISRAFLDLTATTPQAFVEAKRERDEGWPELSGDENGPEGPMIGGDAKRAEADLSKALGLLAEAHPQMVAVGKFDWVVRADAALRLSRTGPPATPPSATTSESS